MSFLASMAGGIGEGMQQTGDMFAKKAIDEAQAARQESLMRLGVELQLEKEETIYQREKGRAPERLEGEITRARSLGAIDVALEVSKETARNQAALTFYNDNREALLGQISDAAELQQKIETEGKNAVFNSIKDSLPEERVDALRIKFLTGIDVEPPAMKQMTEKEVFDAWYMLFEANHEDLLANQPWGVLGKKLTPEEMRAEALRMTNGQFGAARFNAGVARERFVEEAKVQAIFVESLNEGVESGLSREQILNNIIKKGVPSHYHATIKAQLEGMMPDEEPPKEPKGKSDNDPEERRGFYEGSEEPLGERAKSLIKKAGETWNIKHAPPPFPAPSGSHWGAPDSGDRRTLPGFR